MSSFFPPPQNPSLLVELEIENSNLSVNNSVLPQPTGIAVTYIAMYENPASKLDKVQEIYDLLGQINSKKQEIADLCNVAFASTDPTCILDSNEKSLFGDGVILDFEIISANSGGINGTYSDVAANGGSGNGATFNVVVEDDNITSVSISNAGDKYVSGDVLNINGTDIGLPEDGSDFDLILEVTGTDEDELVFSETGKTFRTVGVFPASTFTPVAFGTIRKDNIRVVFYPALEDQSSIPQSDNTAEGLIFPHITSGSTNSEYRGKGKATILSANSSYNDGAIDYRIRDDAGNWSADGIKRGSGWSGGDNILGRFYKLKGDCGGRRSQINTLKSEIAALRAQINGLLPQSQMELLSAINTLKSKKHGYQLQSWSYRRNQKVNNDRIAANNALIDIINDPNNDNIFE
jgi:hypothetical protein